MRISPTRRRATEAALSAYLNAVGQTDAAETVADPKRASYAAAALLNDLGAFIYHCSAEAIAKGKGRG